jgi:hypothetical protein
MESGQQQAEPETFSRASYRQRLVAALVFFVIIGSFASLWVVGHYKITLWPFACGFKQLYGLPCATCGYTTATLAFAQGKIINAFYVQPAAAVFCSLAVVTAFFAFLIAAFGIYSPSFERRLVSLKLRYYIAAVLILVAAGWAVTLTRALAEKSRF